MGLDTDNKHQQLESVLTSYKIELSTQIEQLELGYKSKLSEQEKRISAYQKEHQVALTQSNKIIKYVTAGLIVSFLVGGSSLALVVYPYFTI